MVGSMRGVNVVIFTDHRCRVRLAKNWPGERKSKFNQRAFRANNQRVTLDEIKLTGGRYATDF